MNLYFAALTADSFCNQDAVLKVLKLIGLVITIFKWAIPIMLIVVGSFDLGKAVVSNKPEDIKKTYSGLIKRAIAALIIFFLPAIVGLLVSAVDGETNAMDGCKSALGL